MRLTIQHLRRHAISSTLFAPTTLQRAINRLGFVQADPIRAPARAQDLILRLRVKGYHAGDLERRYASLEIEEDFLYAYGFMPQSTWQLLHPRMTRKLTKLEARVLAIVEAHRQIHPRHLEAFLGSELAVNAWGGYSKATTRALEALHHRGLLRVVRREKGIRLYAATSRSMPSLDPTERLRGLTLLIASILAPVPEKTLQSTVGYAARAIPQLEGRRGAVSTLVKSGDLVREHVDGLNYVWPPGTIKRPEPEEKVCFLAPFDPMVWDRRRFEHLWHWIYRFEAYTPPPKRKMGYYALPVLWRDDVVGWVNVASQAGRLTVEPGFAKQPVNDATYRREFDAEVERVREFLLPASTNPRRIIQS